MLEASVIEPPISKWASAVVLTSKNDDILRLCVDCQGLNTENLLDAYPLLRIDDCVHCLTNSAVS